MPEDQQEKYTRQLGDDADNPAARWRPSIHMPRWASRLTLEVEDVRVERVQEISGAAAAAEGVEVDTSGVGMIDAAHMNVVAFRRLWDSINGPRGYDWESNPWVWVVTFKRVEA